MSLSNFDVVVVGAGAAGVSAAIGLAKSGFRVAVIEAADFPGAENWSGCVYFCESLADPDVLGPDGVEKLAWERRLVERGLFATDGRGRLGLTYRDPDSFRHCYTVLRPIFDHHLSLVAESLGVAVLPSTTVESLIRDGHRVIGVCTNRGPLYADLVFLAEGDASHLVAREGYERHTDPRETPKFLQGIKQVIEMPEGAIEEIFGVNPGEGVAFEMLLRNPTLRGKSQHLNMGGFLYTNARSLSVGLVLPADNLRSHFAGDPNLLMEWFTGLPALSPWLRGGTRGTFGAKLIRGGGMKDVPRLVDDGIAVGGAASAIGIDFPFPNYTGPATLMGLLITRAARAIKAEGGDFSADRLSRHYLEPLQRSTPWRDLRFLRRWPGYVKRSKVFFGRNIDLALGTASVWTTPGRSLVAKWASWTRLLMSVGGPLAWRTQFGDIRNLDRALHLRDLAELPPPFKLFLDGSLNALRDLLGRPRAKITPAGDVRLHFDVPGASLPPAPAPLPIRNWFARFALVLANAARRVYRNDAEPLEAKLTAATALMVEQVNLFDVLVTALAGAGFVCTAAVFLMWDRVRRLVRRPAPANPNAPRGPATDLTPLVAGADRQWDARLATLDYHTVKSSHIHLLWPQSLHEKDRVTAAGLWHVCPAKVYEARVSPLGQLQLVVNYENCIKCETCWRSSDLVDWGRDGGHRFRYAVDSPALDRVQQTAHDVAFARPALPTLRPPLEVLPGPKTGALDPTEMARLLTRLETKLIQFDDAHAEEPRTIDRARAEHLEMLARYAQQLASQVFDLVRRGQLPAGAGAGAGEAGLRLYHLTHVTLTKTEERARRTWSRRYAWAAADGRQIRFHHLGELRRTLRACGLVGEPPDEVAPGLRPWLKAEANAAETGSLRAEWQSALDAVFPGPSRRARDRGLPLTPDQDSLLRALAAQVPPLDLTTMQRSLHPPIRKRLLAELGGRDPSLAYRVAALLLARDLAGFIVADGPTADSAYSTLAARWLAAEGWAAVVVVPDAQQRAGRWYGEAHFVPAAEAESLLLMVADVVDVLSIRPEPSPAAVQIDAVPTLGLRAAGLRRVRLDGWVPSGAAVSVKDGRCRDLVRIIGAADLVSIATGMATVLATRAIQHASTRVQFPGLFHDEASRDTISKFGAVKKMVTEIAARRLLIETVDHTLSPSDPSPAAAEQAPLLKAAVAEALSGYPCGVTYNAGQVFGGTGFSEDDILAGMYRDASAWRFLLTNDADARREHGSRLVQAATTDGPKMAALAGEAGVFDELAQRKALQPELDQIRVLRSRFRSLLGEWSVARGTFARPDTEAEVSEGFGRLDTLLLVSKALLLRVHARLEEGMSAATETALLRAWLDSTAVVLSRFDRRLRDLQTAVEKLGDRPLVDPDAGPPITTYSDYLGSTSPYDSGDFLAVAVDLRQPRFLPELVETDPDLGRIDAEFRDLIRAQFGSLRDGLPFERAVERHHRLSPTDLDFCREHDFFRMPIPREFGGAGRRKVDYYLLIANAHRYADTSVSLTIQANTSIGTTPILVALEKDLPKAKKEINTFLADSAAVGDLRARLVDLDRTLASGEVAKVTNTIEAIRPRLEPAVLSSATTRLAFRRFLRAWAAIESWSPGTGTDGLARVTAGTVALWDEGVRSAAEFLAELDRRTAACELALRWIASGQISAFALTEPSAGSDTARVATRAVLRSVALHMTEDGVYRFTPDGRAEPRFLLDATRLEFRPEGVCYRWTDTAAAAILRFDQYDYETDAPGRTRYFDHDGRRVRFTDIATVRTRDGRPVYDYWELTGAKMWITNARFAGIFCLYARTDEGITGFIVDRHAEGLVVGKDEAKLGQLGSPTNELSLQAVRVPRENVLGLDGRGQVNALETLNVGRTGLAVSGAAQIRGLIEHASRAATSSHQIPVARVRWRLDQLESIRFIAESVAYEVVGRFEHPQTRSLRIESAVAKLLVSELVHEAIDLAEEIIGLPGQTELFLVEKKKRDARVLTIYEGTNEIQRFFVLKDLATEASPRWAAVGKNVPRQRGREAVELETLKSAVRQEITSAVEVFGQGLWQNPNLQASCFLVAEAAAWLFAADCTLGRWAWLSRREMFPETFEPLPEAGPTLQADVPADPPRAAWNRCVREVRDRLDRFKEELTHLRRGFYAPEVRAAHLLLLDLNRSPTVSSPAVRVKKPLSILVMVEPTCATSAHAVVERGTVRDPYWALGPADRAALEQALQVRDGTAGASSVEVVGVGPQAGARALREVISHRVDRVRYLLTPSAATDPGSVALALSEYVAPHRYDLILSGAVPGLQKGKILPLTAALLGVPFVGLGHQFGLTQEANGLTLSLATGTEGEGRASLPAAVGIVPGLPLRPFDMTGYLHGLAVDVEPLRWPESVPLRSLGFVRPLAEEGRPERDGGPSALTAASAGPLLLRIAGLGSGGAPTTQPWSGPIEDHGDRQEYPPGVLGLVTSDVTGTLSAAAVDTLRAVRFVSHVTGMAPTVLVFTGEAEAVQRRGVAGVLAEVPASVILQPYTQGEPPDGFLFNFMKAWSRTTAGPRWVVAEAWAEPGLISVWAAESPRPDVFLQVQALRAGARGVSAEFGFSSRLRVERPLSPGGDLPAIVTLSPSAEIPGAAAHTSEVRVRRLPSLHRAAPGTTLSTLVGEVKRQLGVVRLADARFIIDVGYGVGNRDGYERVIDPLEQVLRALNVPGLAIGGSRKVTEELHLVPADRQIGQSGVRVAPTVLLAIGVSGAPQHLAYIGDETVILAFNRDSSAPIMTLNQRRPRPKVYAVPGDLFETIPALVAVLRTELATDAGAGDGPSIRATTRRHNEAPQ